LHDQAGWKYFDLSRTGEPWLLVDRLGRIRQWFGYWLQGTRTSTVQ